MTVDALLRFERRWKVIFFLFACLFATMLALLVFRLVRGPIAFACVAVSGLGLYGAIFSAGKLGDPDRVKALEDGLSVFDQADNLGGDGDV